MRKTNVRQHTRTLKGRPVNVIRHERRLQEQLGRVGATGMSQASKVVKEMRAWKVAKREPLVDDLVKATVSYPTALFREPTPIGTDISRAEALKEEIEKTKAFIKLQPFSKPRLNEQEVLLLRRRMNDGKISEKEALAVMPRDGWELESDQVEKGRKWLMNIWKNRYGIVKQSSPFEHKQEAALQSFRTAKLVGFESDDGNFFYPRYRVIGTHGQFDYTVKGGDIKFY